MRRKRRLKSNKNYSLSIIYITSIVVLNLIGVSYAMWSDQLNIVGTITTGNITPYFKNEYMISSQQSDGQVNVWFEDQNRDGYNETMRVAGQIEEGESGYIKFSISNGGTLPVKLQKKLQKKQFLHVKHTIKPDEITNAKIDFSHLIVKGNREQNWTIPFVQWNKKRP